MTAAVGRNRNSGVLPVLCGAVAAALLAFACTKTDSFKHRSSNHSSDIHTGTSIDSSPVGSSQSSQYRDARAHDVVCQACEDDPGRGLPSYAQAAVVHDWPRVLELVSALDEVEKNKPEIKYLRARGAIETGDYFLAFSLLDELATHMPSALIPIANDIAEYRAIAQLHRGEGSVDTLSHRGGTDETGAALAAAYFDARSDVVSLTRAARGWLACKQLAKALASINRAVAACKKRTDHRAVQARLVRAQIAQQSGDLATASTDLQFVMQHSRDPLEVSEAEQTSQRLQGPTPVSAQQHFERATQCARKGDPVQTERHLAQIKGAPGKKPHVAEQLMTQARAYYNSRQNYKTAAQLFEKASHVSGSHRAEALYYCGNSWSRHGDNDKGISVYRQVIRTYRNSAWAERAWFYGARLERFELRWNRAIEQYSAYLKSFPKGVFATQSREELALCLLMDGKNDQAFRQLQSLSRNQNNALAATNFRYLSAVAAFERGDLQQAALIWRAIVSAQPLSFFALAAERRLNAMGQAIPTFESAQSAGSDAGSALAATARKGDGANVGALAPVAELSPTVRMLRDLGLSDDAQRYLRAEEQQLSALYGGQAGRLLCELYDQLDVGERLHFLGQTHVPAKLVQVPMSPSTKWAWKCLYPRPYSQAIALLEKKYGLPTDLLHGIMRQESAFAPEATSPVGARGLMQLMPKTAEKTARRMGIDIASQAGTAGLSPSLSRILSRPRVNLDIGASYLAMLLGMMNGHVPSAVAAYNAGPHAVGKWLERGESVPLDVWVALIPYKETREYVWRVLGNWARYRYLHQHLALEKQDESALVQLDLAMPKGIIIGADAY